LKLAPNEVHVWLAFDRELADAASLRAWSALLEPEERSRAGRLRAEHLPEQYVVTRALQRMALSHYAPEVAPVEWRFEADELGKPRLAGEFGPVGLHFNLAHTARLVVMAVARRPLGVDTEQLVARSVAAGVVERYFTPEERGALAALPDSQRQSRFFAIWSLKEAWIKATGEGLSADFQAVSFDFDDATRARAFAMQGDDPGRWGFWQATPSEEHVLSLAMPDAAPGTTISIFRRSAGAQFGGSPVGAPWRLAPRSGEEQRAQP
jgi:4'-phosphopantetheinyl transferase